MMEQRTVMDGLYAGVVDKMRECGFAPQIPEGAPRGANAVYARGDADVMDFAGEKGRLRLVFSNDRVHLLSGPTDVDVSDDSAFNLDATYLFVLAEYGERDLRSLVNEICETLDGAYAAKKAIAPKAGGVKTVSRSAAKSGALAYDPITLATKLGAMFPEFKEAIRLNVETYGEFLCEDFFLTVGNARVMDVIRSNDAARMKKLFGILGEIYEDGTNEVQSLIAVTILGQINDDPVLIQNILPYLTDTMVQPVLSANKRLAKSKNARMRLENPPLYKPKKKKSSGGFLQSLLGGGAPGLGQQ